MLFQHSFAMHWNVSTSDVVATYVIPAFFVLASEGLRHRSLFTSKQILLPLTSFPASFVLLSKACRFWSELDHSRFAVLKCLQIRDCDYWCTFHRVLHWFGMSARHMLFLFMGVREGQRSHAPDSGQTWCDGQARTASSSPTQCSAKAIQSTSQLVQNLCSRCKVSFYDHDLQSFTQVTVSYKLSYLLWMSLLVWLRVYSLPPPKSKVPSLPATPQLVYTIDLEGLHCEYW